MKRLHRAVAAASVALVLAGCPSRELVLRSAEVPWETQGMKQIEMPTFESEPEAWTMADAAYQSLRKALMRGTVEVVERGGQGVLKGAIARFRESSSQGPPRRVLRQSDAVIGETYAWEADVTHLVQLTVVIRLLDTRGGVVWSRESHGRAEETGATDLNWPGHDPMPPPSVGVVSQPDMSLFVRLRETALKQAVDPLEKALTVHYDYERL